MPVITQYRSKKLIYHHTVSTAADNELFTLHTHSFPELMFFVKGKAEQMVENRVYRMRKNDLLYVKPAVHHRIEPDLSTEYERYVLMFDPDIIYGTGGEAVFETTDAINCTGGGIIPEIIKKFDYYCENFEGEDFEEIGAMLIREIFFNISKLKTPENSPQKLVSPLLSRALEYINNNLYTVKSVSEISDSLYITESYLYSMFRQQLRTTPKKYINDKRLLAAQRAIRGGTPPTEVFQEVGFTEYSTFYRSYIKLFGTPPSRKNSTQAITVPGENR